MTCYCEVNDTDYDGDIVVELVNVSGTSVTPHVPAWDEWGHPDLAGPFATRAEAQAALDREAGFRDGIAVYHMPARDCPHFD